MHRTPRFTAVVGAIEGWLLHFDERVHALRIATRHTKSDLAHRARLRQALAKALSVRAAVGALKQATAGGLLLHDHHTRGVRRERSEYAETADDVRKRFVQIA